MTVIVAAARPHDVPALTALLAEKDRFYGLTTAGSGDEGERHVTEALFGETAVARALLAWDGAGMAAYTFLWPAVGFTRSLFLKELYVAGSHRRTGVGRLLMDELFAVAKRHDCVRVEWTTDEINENARRFYAGLGARVRTSKLFYRVDVDGPLT